MSQFVEPDWTDRELQIHLDFIIALTIAAEADGIYDIHQDWCNT